MDRDEFNMLNVEQQVNYINSRLDEDLTLRDVIERKLNLPRSTIRNRFTRNRYVFNKRVNKYIKNSEVKDSKVKNNINTNLPKDESKKTQRSNVNITKSNTVVGPFDCKDKSNANEKDNKFENIQEGNINITKSNMEIYSLENSEIKDLRELLKYKDNILKLLGNKSLNKGSAIDISELSGDLKVKTIKIYDNVLKKFNEFINCHKEFKQQDIISLALKEFLDRHS
ncbi:hypothetical protein [Clostridium frigidicarnis]|uniref:Uncharacterized protein n=1 Tax=Clostridium frigidicarnis TaxID=84698 RepID=A0A1I1B259_9CLOT|nr:hypothetical protein [Clostridium frigidicarnis]SFB44341.1 hypothetical protein SAMN04488528_10588 [Clostridium frigidicarnis]